MRVAQWVDHEKRRLEDFRSAQKASAKKVKPAAKKTGKPATQPETKPATQQPNIIKSGKSISFDPNTKNQRIEELDKIGKEKEDLFKRMSKYPDVFPLNNISYTRRKNMRRKVLQELNPRYLEQPDEPKEPDMTIIFKNVREWIQRSMDVLEKDIMYDKNKKRAGGKSSEQESRDFERDQ